MKAVMFVGGWESHNPIEFANWCRELLMQEGYDAVTFETLAPLEDPESLVDVDVIIPIWSSARSSHQPEFGNMTKPQ